MLSCGNIVLYLASVFVISGLVVTNVNVMELVVLSRCGDLNSNCSIFFSFFKLRGASIVMSN